MLPRGVRFPRPDEFPGGVPDQRRIPPVLTTGYCLREPSGSAGRFSLVEANVHAPQLWTVFRALTLALLPETAAPIAGIKDDEPIFGPYVAREDALAVFDPYVESLTHDGFLEFGIIFQNGERTEEVFVPSPKFLRVWTTAPVTAALVLQQHGIPEVPDLKFVDEFPMVSETLRDEGGSAGWAAVIQALQERFHAMGEEQRNGA